ncbi:MAG: VOC family protein [Acidimicrobiales bacterium]
MADAIVDYIELPATDLAATKSFYTQVFGWEWVDYGPTYAATKSGSVELALSSQSTVGPQHEPGAEEGVGPLVLLQTADLATAEADVRAAGGDIISPPYGYPGGRRFHLVDPSGNVLGVYQPES